MANAIAFANTNCQPNVNKQWLCAEFVCRALNYGGFFPGGVSNYFNYQGVNLAWVPTLVPFLLKNGWYKVNNGQYGLDPGQAGDIIVYSVNGDPLAHVALATGVNKNAQHNPNACNSFTNWGPHMLLRYSGK